MTDNKIKCLACGVFKLEIEALASQGKLDCEITVLNSMLHMKPVMLEQEMNRLINEKPNDRFLLLYGDCHPHMHEMQNMENVSKVAGINCCDILIGREIYRQLQKEQAFVFFPEWTHRWKEVFSYELGFTNSELGQTFMKEYRKKLVYIDTGVIPVPTETIQEISGFFGMPVEIMPVSLDIFFQGINNALQKLKKHGNNGK
ncbi:MAG: DUF1638 domain-containing protein [Salinivirgaceae bacterium]